MGSIEITYEIKGFDRLLYTAPAHWDNCILEMDENLIASVIFRVDGVEDKNQLKNARKRIKEKLKSLVLAFEWKYAHELEWRQVNECIPVKFQNTEGLALESSINCEDKADCDVKPRKPPEEIPQVPLECERWIKTITEAHKLSDYVEEQLRRYYLIIEELWGELKSLYDEDTQDKITLVKLVRDFVSHDSCKNPRIRELVKPSLPSSIIDINGERVRFLRNVEHRDFVAKYATIAHEIAKSLVNKKMEQFATY